jgi:hypothetical protein
MTVRCNAEWTNRRPVAYPGGQSTLFSTYGRRSAAEPARVVPLEESGMGSHLSIAETIAQMEAKIAYHKEQQVLRPQKQSKPRRGDGRGPGREPGRAPSRRGACAPGPAVAPSGLGDIGFLYPGLKPIPLHTSPSSAPKGRRNVARGVSPG